MRPSVLILPGSLILVLVLREVDLKDPNSDDGNPWKYASLSEPSPILFSPDNSAEKNSDLSDHYRNILHASSGHGGSVHGAHRHMESRSSHVVSSERRIISTTNQTRQGESGIFIILKIIKFILG